MWQSQSQYSSLVFTYLHEKATEASQNSAPSGSWTGWHVSPSFPSHFSSVGAALRGYCLTSQPTQLFQACLFHVDRAFVKVIIKFIQQLLKSPHIERHVGKNSLLKLWSSKPKTSVRVSRSLQPSSQSSELEAEESFWVLVQLFSNTSPWSNIEAWA